jgi:hypothetical protein
VSVSLFFFAEHEDPRRRAAPSGNQRPAGVISPLCVRDHFSIKVSLNMIGKFLDTRGPWIIPNRLLVRTRLYAML